MQLSVIIPVYNEAGAILALAAELTAALTDNGGEFEVIWIDDGSTDETPEHLRRVTAWDVRHRAYRLARNSRKSGALQSGFALARGLTIVTMDGDGQDDPGSLPTLLRALDEGADVAVGWRRERSDPLGKRLYSAIFNLLTSLCLGRRFHDMNSGFKAFGPAAAAAASFPGSLYRFVPHLLAAAGYKVQEIAVHHRPRLTGRTKFTLRHRCRALIDLLTVTWLIRYRQTPLALSLRTSGVPEDQGTSPAALAASVEGKYTRF